MPLWDVVSFAANTEDAGALKYMTVGIVGGFSGTYERLKFHEKTRDYELLEDRDLWLIALNLSVAERSALAAQLDSTLDGHYPYTFFERNCAFYLQMLLAKVLPDVPPPSGPTSPTGVMQTVATAQVAGESYFRPSASRRLEEQSGVLSQSTFARLSTENWSDLAQDTAWVRELEPAERRFVQQYFGWKVLERGTALDQGEAAGLALLRYLNSASSQEATPKPQGPGVIVPHLNFHRYSRTSIVLEGSNGGYRTRLELRPGVHDEYDGWTAHRPLNTMEILAFVGSVSVSGGSADPRIDSFVLFSQRSLNPSSWLAPRKSWMLEIVGERGGVFGSETFHVAARSGGGRAFALGRAAWAHFVVTTAIVANREHWAFAPGIDLGILVLPTDRWRLGVRWEREHDLTQWSRKGEAVEGWARFDLTPRTGVRVFAKYDQGRPASGISFDWYP